MSSTLAGFDMVLAISQDEVNAQFNRMASGPQPVIDTFVSANGLNVALGGASYYLSTYLRGAISSPTVDFTDPAAPDSHDHVFFEFTFERRTLSQADLDALGIDTSTLIHPVQVTEPAAGQGDPQVVTLTDQGVALVMESIPITDEPGQSAPNQAVYYWLHATGTIGTQTTWELVPVTYYFTQNVYALVDLTGLTVRFKVNLAMLPTTPEALQALVDDGLLDPSVLSAVDSNGFDQDIFSLQQLFLDFDTVDFTQWALTAPTMDATVSTLAIPTVPGQPIQLFSETLSDLVDNSLDFRTAFSSALQYAFGMNGENTAGATPYIIGINATSNDPAQSNPDDAPSLVPTWIGYGAIANPDKAGWSTINYQVLGGTDPEARVPRNGDGSMVYITTPLVSSDSFSGSLGFSADTFFTPFVLEPIQQSIPISGTWTRSGNTFSISDAPSGATTLYDSGDTLVKWGEGEHAIVTENHDYQCTMTVDGDTISLSGSMYQRQDIKIYLVVATLDTICFHWWYWTTITFSQQITMSIDSDNQLVFQLGAIEQTEDGPHDDENFGGSMVDAVSSLFSTIFNDLPSVSDTMNAMMQGLSSGLSQRINHMNSNLTGAMASNFISPTGDVFFMNAPRFDDQLELFMDVTYRV